MLEDITQKERKDERVVSRKMKKTEVLLVVTASWTFLSNGGKIVSLRVVSFQGEMKGQAKYTHTREIRRTRDAREVS